MVKVYLFQREGRRFYECQWFDPITGKRKTKSTKTEKKREAERFAGSLESDLNSGRFEETTNATWENLANRYETEVLQCCAVKTGGKFKAARNALTQIIDPKFANTIDASLISRFQSGLRDKGLAEATIKGHLASLRACFNWAVRIGMMRKAPHITMPKRIGKMKGRPITGEEFDRMLAAVTVPENDTSDKAKKRAVLPIEYAEPWKFLLRGLWESGLRLSEAMRLNWTKGPITVNLSAGIPRLKIEANSDKSGKPRLLPVSPGFAELLLSVPEAKRHGKVFNPLIPGQIVELRLDTCSKVISRIGKMAGVVVAEFPARGKQTEPRKKFASAHDLRRAFGTRWSKQLRPRQLQDLMRHESLQTTMTFYVEESIADVETAMRQQPSNTSANTPQVSDISPCENPVV